MNGGSSCQASRMIDEKAKSRGKVYIDQSKIIIMQELQYPKTDYSSRLSNAMVYKGINEDEQIG